MGSKRGMKEGPVSFHGVVKQAPSVPSVSQHVRTIATMLLLGCPDWTNILFSFQILFNIYPARSTQHRGHCLFHSLVTMRFLNLVCFPILFLKSQSILLNMPTQLAPVKIMWSKKALSTQKPFGQSLGQRDWVAVMQTSQSL